MAKKLNKKDHTKLALALLNEVTDALVHHQHTVDPYWLMQGAVNNSGVKFTVPKGKTETLKPFKEGDHNYDHPVVS